MSKELEFYGEKDLAEIIYCLAKENCQPCVELAVSLEECETGAQTTINALSIAEKMLVDESKGYVEYNERGHAKGVIGSTDEDRYTKAFSYINQERERITSDELSLINNKYLSDTLYTLALNCHEQVETVTYLSERCQLNVEDALREAEKKLTQRVSGAIAYNNGGSVANAEEINNPQLSNAISAIGVELKKRDIDFY